jgi:hypothetical protein
LVTEDDVLAFVRVAIRSAWSLELLLLLRRTRPARWTTEALVRELRGSAALVAESVAALGAAGLVTATTGDEYAYQPQSAELDELAAGVADLYASKPLAVFQAIFATPEDKLRSFSDAFLFKKK